MKPKLAPPEQNATKPLDRRFCVAPMMDWTDRHFRYFARLISQHAVLYTEMVTTGALIHGDRNRFLEYAPSEHPLALQLGGSDINELKTCAKMAEDWGYDEVNLNVGCPSDRVQNNMIGACLMAHPELVRDCLGEMQNQLSIPVTVKHRIGIDEQDINATLDHFLSTVSESGVNTFIVHARKALLQGLSPKENRDIPPLVYERVYRLKQDFPHLEIIINGGIKTQDECKQHLEHVDGVMIGREAYHNPWLLAKVDEVFYGQEASDKTRLDILQTFLSYVEQELEKGTLLGHITRHILGLFHSQPGGKKFRRYLSENAHKKGAGIEVLEQAISQVG